MSASYGAKPSIADVKVKIRRNEELRSRKDQIVRIERDNRLKRMRVALATLHIFKSSCYFRTLREMNPMAVSPIPRSMTVVPPSGAIVLGLIVVE